MPTFGGCCCAFRYRFRCNSHERKGTQKLTCTSFGQSSCKSHTLISHRLCIVLSLVAPPPLPLPRGLDQFILITMLTHRLTVKSLLMFFSLAALYDGNCQTLYAFVSSCEPLRNVACLRQQLAPFTALSFQGARQ